MSKHFLKALPELVEANVIAEETAEKIRLYYQSRPDSSSNRVFVIFGVLGAILVGLGIILIVAHNWDDLSHPIKVFFAFLPILVAQGLCGYTLLKKADSQVWRESCGVLLFLAVPASISMISQIYQIPGNISDFLFVWMLLTVPLVYLMQSSLVSLLYLVGITCYAANVGYWDSPNHPPLWYLLMIALILPYYYLLFRNNRNGNFFALHSFFLPLSLTFILGAWVDEFSPVMTIVYAAWFSILFLKGSLPVYQSLTWRFNPLQTLGIIGSLLLLYTFSFPFFWNDLPKTKLFSSGTTLYLLIFLILAGVGLLIYRFLQRKLQGFNPVEVLFIVFAVIYFIGISSPETAMWLTNLLILWIGVSKIMEGTKNENIGVMNYGFLIVAILIVCRFFDQSLSFIIKGLIFILLGVGFFIANYQMFQKRKKSSL